MIKMQNTISSILILTTFTNSLAAPLVNHAEVELVMLQNNDFDTIMPEYYNNNPLSTMHYQNFEDFHDAQLISNSEMNMEESGKILSERTPYRAPQPLSYEERRVREMLQPVDQHREYKLQKKLKKGSTKRLDVPLGWDLFDYDLYSVDPAKSGLKG